MTSRSPSPANKRIKLEDEGLGVAEEPVADEEDEDQCIICLHAIADRTVIPPCSHDAFCFECIVIWSEQSRRCPLCTQPLGDHLIHNIYSNYNYQKFYLPPLPSAPVAPVQPLSNVQSSINRRTRLVRERQWGRRHNTDEREDEFERALEKRRKIYRYGLYAKHTASNVHTKYKPYPTPAQFSANQELIARATAFLRRELRVWVNLDVEFLTTFTISIMKSIDIRTEAAVRLLSEFLDMDEHGNVDPNRTIGEHFAHEVYSFMRSPYKDLFVYDTVVQYDPFPEPESSRRRRDTRSRPHQPVGQGERSGSPSTSRRERSPYRRGRSRSRSRSSSRSVSYSPSGRYYHSERRRACSPASASPPRYSMERAPSVSSDRARRKRKGKERENAPESYRTGQDEQTRKSLLRSPSPQQSSSRWKGKEREEVRDSRSRTLSAEAESEEYGPERPPSSTESRQAVTEATVARPAFVPEPTENPAPKQARPPRRRTLLESVQDHLGTNKPGSSTRPLTNPQKPSLMDRLSFPSGTSASSRKEDSNASTIGETALSPTSNSSTPATSITAVSTPVAREDDADEKPGPSHVSTSDQRPRASSPPPLGPKTDARSVLLRRLLEEKRKMNATTAAVSEPVPIDSEAAENELRLKAKLNVKKRKALDGV